MSAWQTTSEAGPSGRIALRPYVSLSFRRRRRREAERKIQKRE
jgi:hypothetical protein